MTDYTMATAKPELLKAIDGLEAQVKRYRSLTNEQVKQICGQAETIEGKSQEIARAKSDADSQQRLAISLDETCRQQSVEMLELRTWKTDIEKAMEGAMEPCDDEVHCTCVGPLRGKIRQQNVQLWDVGERLSKVEKRRENWRLRAEAAEKKARQLGQWKGDCSTCEEPRNLVDVREKLDRLTAAVTRPEPCSLCGKGNRIIQLEAAVKMKNETNDKLLAGCVDCGTIKEKAEKIAELEKEVDELETDGGLDAGTISDQHDEIEVWKKENAELKEEVADLKRLPGTEILKNLRLSLKSHKTKITELEKEVKGLSSDIEMKDEWHTNALKDIGQLQETQAEMEAELRDAENRCGDANKRVGMARAGLEAARVAAKSDTESAQGLIVHQAFVIYHSGKRNTELRREIERLEEADVVAERNRVAQNEINGAEVAKS